MSAKSLTVLNSRCAHKQNCTVLATTVVFGDPCPGTHKYLEAHYQCVSAAQTSTTTNRPSPPRVLTNTPPSLLANGSSIINPPHPPPPQLPLPGTGGNIWSGTSSAGTLPTPPPLPGGRIKNYNGTSAKGGVGRHDGIPPPPPLHHHHTNTHQQQQTPSGALLPAQVDIANGTGVRSSTVHEAKTAPTSNGTVNASTSVLNPSKTHILTGGGSGNDDSTLLTKNSQNRSNNQQGQTAGGSGSSATQQTVLGGAAAGGGAGGNSSGGLVRNINNINNYNGIIGDEDESSMYCGPKNARNLFWNVTRVGESNVQPCPGGATGIAKWRCVLMKRVTDHLSDEDHTLSLDGSKAVCTNSNCAGTISNKVNHRSHNFEPTWHPLTPDLTQCRSLWLNNLEVRVNQRDSSLISIANDLSEVTSSKTLYGGDMLVTTKIIQTMSEKMYYDKETFPDQRQREAIIFELLHGVVKTGSNLLDESQLSSWLDLNQEDQMRVATSLLTGLEYNAFLLADTIIRERNVVQKVKNILLSVRVLETKNIQTNEVFPDAEQWQISDDRIELPRAALSENSEGGLVRIVFAAFDRLESILKPSYDHFDLKSSRSYVRNSAVLGNDSESSAQLQRIRILNSKVISASLGKGRHIQLSQPIKLILRHLKTENVTNPTCVFWNYIDHAWSANGCNLEATNRTHSICMCNHLTNFALLMDVMDEHNHSLFSMLDGNMRILIYISISICLLFIIIALLTLKIFNGVFIKSTRTSIYRSIYICLFIIEIIFIVGIEQNEASIFCGFTTVFLHCSILCAIAWFCFEAFQSYSTLTTDDMLVDVDQTSKLNCYYLLSYGLSLTIVAISLAIDPSTYTRNDYCLLMEPTILFYLTFVTPIFIFILAAICYTFLSWIIMCRKSCTTLKNKEHTRLASVRFDIRCSFIFLLILIIVWISAYLYLRKAKVEDDVAIIFGYVFVGFNTLMGIYIFVFHCIQNEKIRREYRKYIRQNSWLPKCLRCSKTSISSGVGSTGVAGGTNSGNTISGGTQLKKKSHSLGGASASTGAVEQDDDETGGIIKSNDDGIIANSDCELNEATIIGLGSRTAKSGIIPGSLSMQHGNKVNAIVDSLKQGKIVVERGTTGTMRSAAGGSGSGGGGAGSAGHTSPTSSAGSTHLIFGHGHKQQQAVAGGSAPNQQEALYHHPDYYSWKQQNMKSMPNAAYPRDYLGNVNTGSGQSQHEFFYWTQKHQQHGKKKRGGSSSATSGPDSPSGSLHSRATAASQQILYYPSYKKTTLKNQQQQQQQQYPHYAEAMEPSELYQRQQHSHPRRQTLTASKNQHQYLHAQQQLSSDEEQVESCAHPHLLHLMGGNNNGTGGGSSRRVNAAGPGAVGHPHQYMTEFGPCIGGGSGGGGGGGAPLHQQRFYRNKHSNCDFTNEYDTGSGSRGGSESYYNQGSLSGDGPVYEEILSNRNSDVPHYEVEDEDEHVGRDMVRPQRHPRIGMTDGSIDDDDDDESACYDDEDDDGSAHNLQRSDDERMRRLMAKQDEDFQRRFHRQQMKNAAEAGFRPQHEHQQNAVFGVSGDGVGGVASVTGGGCNGGSMRSFKRSPSGRLPVMELFNQAVGNNGGSLGSNYGPPLPPANQHPMPKRQKQQQQQQKSPQSTTSSQQKHFNPSQQQPQQQQPIGRNISAMLDENNTVRCYLEPLSK